jgi:hypothetical protein
MGPSGYGEEPESVLIQRCSQGDRRAFDVLHERYERPIFHFVCVRVGNPEEADEDESIHEDGLRQYFRELGAVPGLKGLVCNGHTGEIMALSLEELWASDATSSANKGTCPVPL